MSLFPSCLVRTTTGATVKLLARHRPNRYGVPRCLHSCPPLLSKRSTIYRLEKLRSDLNGESSGLIRHVEARLDYVSRPPAKQITMRSPPDGWTKEQFASDLKKIVTRDAIQATIISHIPQALVILVTPKYVEWLEESPELIEIILGRLLKPVANEKEYSVEVDVICACVDGLSAAPDLILTMTADDRDQYVPEEGFSFLTADRKFIAPYLWHKASMGEPGEETTEEPTNESTETSPEEDAEGNASLTFYGNSNQQLMCVTLPLANTLFKIGRPSMLSVTKWRSFGDSYIQVTKVSRRKNVAIKVFGSAPQMPLISAPALPLTPARKITKGLGNIVRSLDFENDGIRPASWELEQIVPVFTRFRGRENSLVEVWAIVIPDDVVKANSEVPYMMDLQVVNVLDRIRLWSDPGRNYNSQYIGYWIDQGAAFCRVLSGGGGWGPKQGLLSLDPQTSYSTPKDARYDFSEASLEEQQASALGSIAEEGAYIQFFAFDSRCETYPPPKSAQIGPYKEMTTVFGTVPSSIDNVTLPSKHSEKVAANMLVRGQQGHFGCVSESGMFIHWTPRNGHYASETPPAGKRSTKVDLPYSFLIKEQLDSWEQVRFQVHLEEAPEEAKQTLEDN